MKMALSTAAAPRMLVRSTRLLAAIGGLAMATTGECSPLVLAAFLLFFLIGMKIEAFPAPVRFLGAAQPYFALIVFGLAIADFFMASQSFLLAVAHFLLGLQALRLMALRTNRENLGSVLVSSLMVLSASTLAIDWTFFVMLLCFLPALVWTLMLHTVALESDLASAPTETAAPGVSSDPLRGSSPVWRQMAPSLRRAAAAAFGIAVVCCAFVFVIFPRFNFQGFRGQFLQPLRKTGFTSQVDLGASGRIYDDPAIVMRVEVPESDRAHWTGYIRGSVLDEFEDNFWRRASRPLERVYPTGLGEFHLRASGRGAWIRQSIYLESMDTPVLFAASHPFFVRIDRPYLEVGTDGTIQRRQSDAWRIHYDVTSAPTAGREPFLTGVGLTNRSLAAAEAKSDTQLPDAPLARLAALARDQGGGGTPAQIAGRLAAYLRNNYTYTTDTPPSGGESPVEHFLFSSKRGHCEYFASALALMLRYRGIPARIVTGFLSRQWNRRGGYYIVRMKHAHAWVEYFTPDAGWVEIDPSPRDVDEGEDDTPWERNLRETWDYLNLRWNRYILSYDLEKQVSIIRSVTVRTGRMSAGLEHFLSLGQRLFSVDGLGWHPRLHRQIRIPVGPLLMGAVVVLLSFLVRHLRRRSGGVWFYRSLIRLLERAGAHPAPARTLRELLDDARPRLGDGATSAEALTEAYYRVRFAPGAAISRAESRILENHLKKLRRSIAPRAVR